MNLTRGLLGLASEEPEEKLSDVPSIYESCENVHEKVKAVIYSFLNVESAYALTKADHYFESPPRGDDLMGMFRQPFSVYLSK